MINFTGNTIAIPIDIESESTLSIMECLAPECYGHLVFSPSQARIIHPQGVFLIHLYQEEVTIGRADCTMYV